MTILFAGLVGGVWHAGAEWAAQPYHPVFNVPQFEAATKDKFFIVIFSSTRIRSDADAAFLESLKPDISGGGAQLNGKPPHRFRFAGAGDSGGCRNDMYDQPRFKPLAEERFLCRLARRRVTPVEGTVRA